jgi:CheY-like chemotaxis protein
MNVGRVLVVEDNYVVNQELCELLEESGHIVKPVYSGQEAFEAIQRKQYFTALLTDIDLGGTPDGIDVARYARAHYPQLPVIFVSGTLTARQAAHGVAGSVFVAKPFTSQQVLDALAAVIEREAA